MRVWTFVSVLFVGFAVLACMPRSQVPLPTAGNSADGRLVGVWIAEADGERVEFAVSRAGEDRLRVVALAFAAEDEDDGDGGPERMVLDATTSEIGGRGYLSITVIESGEDDEDEDFEPEGFYICLYELEPGDTLAVRCLATDPVVEDVEAGQVAGTVERGEYVTEVTLTADGAALARYLRSSDTDRLFFVDEPLMFRRASP